MVQLSTGHVFMSYSRRDDVVMRRIVTFMRKQGIKVWVDNEKLIPGTPIWEEEIEKAIKSAPAIVVVLSPDSKNSEWVRREISLADQYRKRVFPVLVRGEEETSITLRLMNRQYVDIRNEEDTGLSSMSASLLLYLEELKVQEQKETDRLTAQKDEEERLARQKVEEDRREREEAKRLALLRAKEERISQSKVEAKHKAEEEHLATEKAGVERNAKEEQEKLFRNKVEPVFSKPKIKKAQKIPMWGVGVFTLAIILLSLWSIYKPSALPITPTATTMLAVATKLQTAIEAPTTVPVPTNPDLILATTTSTQDSGLLDVLIPMFEAQTGYKVKTVAVGSATAITMGQEGNADILLIHSPETEVTFMSNGWGKDRALVMHNDYIIVGPSADPAKIKGLGSTQAFTVIADSGSTFVARADLSSTSTKELSIWKKAGIDPASAKPAWYIETGQSMGPVLTITSEKGGYTLTDRATYLANKDKLQLEILVEGENALLNVYHVITIDQTKWPKTNYDGAIAFLKFMTDPAIQEVIGKFGVDKYGQQLFIPDATKTDADLGL